MGSSAEARQILIKRLQTNLQLHEDLERLWDLTAMPGVDARLLSTAGANPEEPGKHPGQQ